MTTFWETRARVKYEKTIDPNHPFYINTGKARGDYSHADLLKMLMIKTTPEFKMMAEPEDNYIVFTGHRGCGKSTELRRLSSELDKPDLFFVVFLDTLKELDVNNCSYADVCLALAKELLSKLKEQDIHIDNIFLENLEKWFSEKISTHESVKEFASEIKAEVKGGLSIPYLFDLFSKLTSAFKIGSTYKDQLRTVVANSFSEFSSAFNSLINAAEDAVRRSENGKKIIFIIDGTDRLRGDEGRKFFIDNAHQLKQIRSNFIYCASIDMLHEEGGMRQNFQTVSLPMIKLRQKESPERISIAYETLRKLVYKRIPAELFDSEETVNYLIDYSGGNSRDLLKLLDFTFLNAEGEIFDRTAAEKAVQQMATEYRRLLNAEDYALLYKIDHSERGSEEQSEHSRKLLYNLLLLEYNSFFWLPHPTIRILPAYKSLAENPESPR